MSLIIVDEFSKFSWLYPLKLKSEVTHKIQLFHAMVTTQFHSFIQTLRSDNGGEFLSTTLTTFLATNGIIHHTSYPHTPEQNGVAERKHRHLIETTVALLHQAHLSTKFWLDALCTAIYLINRMPTPILSFSSPYEILYGQSPDYSVLRVFGCLCFPLD